MADDLTDVIAGAIHDAEDGIIPDAPEPSGDTGGSDAGDSGDTGSGTGEVSPSSGAAVPVVSPSATPPPAAAEPPAEDDELTKELAAHGIYKPVEGQREGRFTWGKVRKVLDNTRKKLTDQHTIALKERDTKLAEQTQYFDSMRETDRLFRTDPEKFMQTIARMNPAYQKFLQPAPAEVSRESAAAAEQPPGPDAQYADGSWGYSPEGLEKLRAYDREQTKREVLAAVKADTDQRFGPIEKQWKQTAAQREFERVNIPIVRNQITAAKEIWGELFQSKLSGDKDDDPEIVAAIAQYPNLDFGAIVAKVLRPRLDAKLAALKPERDTMRADLIREMNGRPAAASRSGAGSVVASNGKGDESIDDVIKNAMRAAEAGHR